VRPVLTVFVDGLKPESVERMPFVREFDYRSRIRTELGYSVTCHSSMYSGVRPNKHLNWFIWQKGARSMYPWVKYISRHPGSNSMVTAYAAYRLTRMFSKSNTSYYGVKYITGSCFRYWHEFEMVEKKLWPEPGFHEFYPTVFDILRDGGVPFTLSGFRRFGGAPSLDSLSAESIDECHPWTYVFVGDIDGLTHQYGQESDVVTDRIRAIDESLRQVYEKLSKDVPELAFMLFSDHGMAEVDHTFDIKAHFRKYDLCLSDYCHMIDNNYARFWFRTDEECAQVEKAVSTIEPGYIITEDMARRYHVDMPDNRFGDLLFYLDLPYAFGRAWYPLNLSAKTKPYHHGYSPEHASMDGVLVSSEPLRDNNLPIELCDIMPSILSMLDVPLPAGLDGVPIWQTS